MLFAFTIGCAVLPSLALLAYFYKKDVNPEPRRVIAATFFLGILTVFPVMLLGRVASALMPPMSDPTLAALVMAFGLAAVPEEFFKFLVVVLYCSRHREFDEPIDGMIYGAVASLGFATFENIQYVSQGGLGTALSRALTSVPCHAFLGAIMGYFVARARFLPQQRGYHYFLALFLPILLHGLYDYPLIQIWLLSVTQGDEAVIGIGALALLVVPFLVLGIMGFITVRLMHRLRTLQLYLKEVEALQGSAGAAGVGQDW